MRFKSKMTDDNSALSEVTKRSETDPVEEGQVFSKYLRDKFYEAEVSERWQRKAGVYHSSKTGHCDRQRYYEWTTEQETSDASSWPYFELGVDFEEKYGDALAVCYGEDMIRQDIEIEIRLADDMVIVGESDWCVLHEPLESHLQVRYQLNEQTGTRTEITYEEDTGKTVESRVIQGDALPKVAFVIETKTTNKIQNKETYGHLKTHEYQLRTYLHGMGVPYGYVTYLERNNMAEKPFRFDHDEAVWLDIKMRTITLHANLNSSDPQPPAVNPMGKTDCWYCDYRDECNAYDGGSEWS